MSTYVHQATTGQVQMAYRGYELCELSRILTDSVLILSGKWEALARV